MSEDEYDPYAAQEDELHSIPLQKLVTEVVSSIPLPPVFSVPSAPLPPIPKPPSDYFIPPPPPLPPLPTEILPPPPTSDEQHASVSVPYSTIVEPPSRENEEDHAKRMEIENKKRKMAGGRALNSIGRLKKVSALKAFGFEDGNNDNELNGQKSTNLSASETKTAVEAETVSNEEEILIGRTAAWVLQHPDKLGALLERSRDNRTMQFLFNRHTAAGRRYLDELSRLKAEKDVNEVFHGSSSSSGLFGLAAGSIGVASSNNNNLLLMSEVNKEKIRQAALIAASIKAPQPSPPFVPPPPQQQIQVQIQQIQQQLQQQSSVPAASTNNVDSTNGDTQPRIKKSRWGVGPSGNSAVVQTTAHHAISSGGSNGNANSLNTLAGLEMVGLNSSSSSSSSSVSKLSKWSNNDKSSLDQQVIAEAAKSFEVTGGEEELNRAKLWAEQVKQQKELQLLESKIREAAMRSAAVAGTAGVGSSGLELHQERLQLYEDMASRYDEHEAKDTLQDAESNGYTIDGGTWEHRKRAKEMLATAEANLALTALATGKHHMSDFLPKEELDKFLKKANAVKAGEKITAESQYEENKLTAANIGYQMLAAAGWKEGSALGSSNNNNQSSSNNSVSHSAGTGAAAGAMGGIIEPIHITGQGTETTGLGVFATHEVTAEDSEFDQYRKRMMLAYRFRPNPLNNPRRSYY